MMHERANLMFQTAALLKRLANRFHLAVVVVNQVSLMLLTAQLAAQMLASACS